MKIAIIGSGNIGKAAEQAVLASVDMTLVGIFHHDEVGRLVSSGVLSSSSVDVALLCLPTREVQSFAELFLSVGICTVDSFDIHTQIPLLRHSLSPVAVKGKSVGMIAAGWDPGSDSVVRCLMQAMAPKGITYTNFGPGRSMGHSVAAKSKQGVRDALSMTIPLGTGVHRRMVYVELEPNADFRQVERDILADDYFAHDETHVIPVDSVDALNSVAHGVDMVRSGVSGTTHNQRFQFLMTINNPALTAQVMVACARAVLRLRDLQRYGAYTLIEVPPIYLLSGSDEDNIQKLV